MDGSVIQKTKDTLGTVITKPPMTDKLLGKPPFRYLHDIISSVRMDVQRGHSLLRCVCCSIRY